MARPSRRWVESADHPAVGCRHRLPGTSKEATILHSITTFHSADASSDGSPDLMLWLATRVGDPLLCRRGRAAEAALERFGSAAGPKTSTRRGSNSPTSARRPDVDRLARGMPAADGGSRGERRFADCARTRRAARRGRSQRAAALRPRERLLGPPTWWERAQWAHNLGGAVVDAYGRVYGAEGLFVIDASIIPDAPSGFPPTSSRLAIAERLEQIWGVG